MPDEPSQGRTLEPLTLPNAMTRKKVIVAPFKVLDLLAFGFIFGTGLCLADEFRWLLRSLVGLAG